MSDNKQPTENTKAFLAVSVDENNVVYTCELTPKGLELLNAGKMPVVEGVYTEWKLPESTQAIADRVKVLAEIK